MTSPEQPEPEIIDAEIVPDPVSLPPDAAFAPVPGLDYTDAGVPTLDYVRDKIAGRLGTAQGSAELAEAAADRGRGREQTMAQREADREKAAADRLAQIRASLQK